MNFVRKYLFWLVMGVIAAGALIFWVLAVVLKQGQLSEQEGTFASLKTELQRWAGPKRKSIRNPKDVQAVKEYRKALADTEKKIRDRFTALNINIDPSRWPERPPVNDLALFRRWIQQQYKARDAAVARLNKNMKIAKDPEDPGKTGDYSLDALNLQNIPVALKRLVVSSEIYRILASARAEVNTLERDVEGSGEEKVTRVVRTVDELTSLRFFDSPEQAEAARYKRAGAMAPTQTSPVKPPFRRPYKRHVFELEFVAHYSLVPQIIENIIKSKQMFVTITRMDIYRHPASTPTFSEPKASPFGQVRRETAAYSMSREARRLLNSRYQEGPVVVVLECEVLEFDFPKAEQAPNEG